MESPQRSLSISRASGSVMPRYVPVRNLIGTVLLVASNNESDSSITPLIFVKEVIISILSASENDLTSGLNKE